MTVNQHALGGILLDEADGSKVVTNTKGLDDAPEIRSGVQVKAQQDGAWDASGFYGPRVIQLQGFAELAASVDAHAFADSLRALSPAAQHEFAVTSPGRGTRQAMVRMQSGAVVEWVDDRRFTYVITVIAPDPLLYGPEVYGSTVLSNSSGGTGLVYPLAYPLDYGVAPGVTPGSLTVANAGTAPYWPRLRIDGPVTNPVVTLNETGDSIRFSGSVDTGQWIDIDCARRRVLLNGNASRRFAVYAPGSWLQIPVGGGSLSIAADSAGAAASLSVWSNEGAWS